MTNRSKPFGPFLIFDSLSHVVVVAGQGVQKERQHAQLEVRYVNLNFLTHLYISRRVLLKTKVFLRQKLPPDFISKRRIH